jgi:exodeoxyribonuclease VII large subunit
MIGTPFAFLPPPQAKRPYTVTEINEGVSLILESGNTLVWVEGEISNWKVASSGHSYFKLKDAECQVPAVMWRQSLAKLDYEPEDGLSVLVIASIKVYRKSGYYQLGCHRMEPLGRGAHAIAFEKLKKRLEQEGLFDPAKKIPLPASIRRIGVVTSLQGAAIRDIVRVIASRAPQIDITVADVPVQGETAAPRIARAIRDLNAWGNVDCIIVGRGGGSAEDLWPFNEEAVARAIYDSEIAVVSAVGHEIDFTISDFVADARAPTPSAAAEMAAPDTGEQANYLNSCSIRFSHAVSRYFSDINERYASCVSSRAIRLPLQMISERIQSLDDGAESFSRALRAHFKNVTGRFSSAASRLSDLSPLSVLSRGYSVVSSQQGAVRNASELSVDQKVFMRFFKGSAEAHITSISSEKPLE